MSTDALAFFISRKGLQPSKERPLLRSVAVGAALFLAISGCVTKRTMVEYGEDLYLRGVEMGRQDLEGCEIENQEKTERLRKFKQVDEHGNLRRPAH